MTTTEEIIRMKEQFAAEHGGIEANVLFITDSKWHQWWFELTRIGNPHVGDKLALAIGRKGFAAMRGKVWQGLRVERLNPSNQPQYRTFVDREAVATPAKVDVADVAMPAARAEALP